MAIQKLFTSLSRANASTYVGEKGRIFFDSVLGLRVSDGVTHGGHAVPVAVTNANIGDLVITGATIESLNTNENITLRSNGTGNVEIIGAFNVTTTGGSKLIETLQNGTTNFYVPNINSLDSAVDIIGSIDGRVAAVQNTGVMLHITGQDGSTTASRIYNDGVQGYAAYIGRRYNGSAATPTAVNSGELVSRVGATPYTSTGWPALSTARIDFVATENQTGSAQGSQIEFYTTPNGTNSTTADMIVSSAGITNNANITPGVNNRYSLGTTDLRWRDVYVGPSSLHMQDTVTLADIQIKITDGTLFLNGAQNLAIGNLIIQDTTLQTITSSTDMSLGDPFDTGNVKVGRAMQIYSAAFPSDRAALTISGSGYSIPPYANFADTMLRVIGKPGETTRSALESYGTGAYGTYSGRTARGTISSPTATKAGDLILRFSGQGRGATTWGGASGRMDLVASEDFTDTAQGSQIDFWINPIGSNTIVNSARIDSTGVVGTAFTFTGDSTRQTTAGIPLTQKGVATGVATLGIDGKLTNAQIPSSLTGAIVFQGGWDASTNTPTLSNGTGTTGYQYIVTVAGNRNLGAGNVAYASGDTITYGANVWNYTQGTSPISSVSGNAHVVVGPTTGAVVIGVDATSNMTAGTIVARDGSGNFGANIISATLSGAATTAGTVTTAAQPNITSVGTLTSLNVNGNIIAGNVTASSGTITAVTGQFTNINNSLTGANAAIVTANSAVVSYVNSLNSAMIANVVAANAAIVTANSAVVSYVNSLNSAMIANVVAANAAIVTANSAVVSYVNTQVSSIITNANANTAAYLSNGISTNIVTTGNVNAGNVNIGATTYSNLSITSTATAADFTIGLTTSTGNLVLNRTTVMKKDAYVTGNIYVGAGSRITAPKVIINDGGIKTYVGNTAVTLNFDTDEIVFVQNPTNNLAFTLGTLVAGSTIRCIVTMATKHNIAFGVSATNNSTTGATSVAGAALANNQAVQLVYTCIDGTAGNTYVAVSYQ